MSTYATTDELQKRLAPYPGLLTLDDGSFDVALAQAYLDSVEAEIDSCAAERYVTPVEAPRAVSMLKNWALTLAEELAHNANVSHGETPDNVKARVKAVRDGMVSIREGEMSLIGADELPTSAGGMSEIDADEPQMTRGKLGGW